MKLFFHFKSADGETHAGQDLYQINKPIALCYATIITKSGENLTCPRCVALLKDFDGSMRTIKQFNSTVAVYPLTKS